MGWGTSVIYLKFETVALVEDLVKFNNINSICLTDVMFRIRCSISCIISVFTVRSRKLLELVISCSDCSTCI